MQALDGPATGAQPSQTAEVRGITQKYHVLVLDGESPHKRGDSKLLLIDVDAGKAIKQIETAGRNPEVCVSDNGKFVAVLTHPKPPTGSTPPTQLHIYRSHDLSLVASGFLPLADRSVFQGYPPYPTLAFSPDCSEVVWQAMRFYNNKESPPRTYEYVSLMTVKRELDVGGTYKWAYQSFDIPCCRVVTFLTMRAWPQICIWNNMLGAVEIVDLAKREIKSRLLIADHPTLSKHSPEELEQPSLKGRAFEYLSHSRGTPFVGGPHFVYYVPTAPAYQVGREIGPYGRFRKLDVSGCPKVVSEGTELEKDIRASWAGVSEPTGTIYTVKDRLHRNNFTHLDSRTLKVYKTDDCRFIREFDVSLPSIHGLYASRDGKYVYVLSHDNPSIEVLDAKTGKHEGIVKLPGTYPTLAFALPETM